MSFAGLPKTGSELLDQHAGPTKKLAEGMILTWRPLHGPAGVAAWDGLVHAAWRLDNLGLADLCQAAVLRNLLCTTHQDCEGPFQLQQHLMKCLSHEMLQGCDMAMLYACDRLHQVNSDDSTFQAVPHCLKVCDCDGD